MAKIGGGQQPRAPAWPWGGPRAVRDKLVDKAQLKSVRKKGDPKNPALASAALLDFIAPAHSADELRLPMPPMPGGHDADLEGFQDRHSLGTVAERMQEVAQLAMERGLTTIKAPPDRVDRMKALLARESQMLEIVGGMSSEMQEIERRRREETQEEGF